MVYYCAAAAAAAGQEEETKVNFAVFMRLAPVFVLERLYLTIGCQLYCSITQEKFSQNVKIFISRVHY